jgi:hypothetical protein
MKTAIFAALIFAVLASAAFAQEPFPGLTLVSPRDSNASFLIDLELNVIRTWHGASVPTEVAYLLPNNAIVRPTAAPNLTWGAGGRGGRIQMIDKNDIVVWDFLVSNDVFLQHHDIEPMPNGNVLVIAWERILEHAARAAGREELPDGEIWPTAIFEFQRVGPTEARVVWEWHLWDHIIQDVDPEKTGFGVIADHPELLDVNYGAARTGGDWDHANSVSYNPDRDQILFCSPKMNEFYIIDHSTTTEEAAGHVGGNRGRGGDFLYRWGNPAAYGRGDNSDKYYFGIHGSVWIECGLPGEGGVLTFNNGRRRPGGNFSSVEEIHPPKNADGNYLIAPGEAFGPSTPSWVYDDRPEFYSQNKAGAFRLPNGNTLITEANDHYIFEVTVDGEKVWDYTAPAEVHRAPRYWSPTTPKIVRLDLKPGSCPNMFNIQWLHPETPGEPEITAFRGEKGGVLPAALLGSDCLDVSQVDPMSLRLEGIEPLRTSIEDVGRSSDAGPCECGDDGLDGIPDLELKFSRAAIAGILSSVLDGNVARLTLTGQMVDGTPFTGQDCLTILRKELPPTNSPPLFLSDASPNPFNPRTTIRYRLRSSGEVCIKIYDVAGRLVRTLVDHAQASSGEEYVVTWNGESDAGRPLPSGVYYYRLATRDADQIRKMLLIK